MSKCSKDKYAWDIYFPIPETLISIIFPSNNIHVILTLTELNHATLYFTKYCIEWFAGKCEKKYRICPEDIHVKYVQAPNNHCVPYGPRIACKQNACDISNHYLSQAPGFPDIFFPNTNKIYLYVCFNIKATRIYLKTPSLYNNYYRNICYDHFSSKCIYSLDLEPKEISRCYTNLPKCPIRGKKPDISYITICENPDDEPYPHPHAQTTNYYFKTGSLNISSGPFLMESSGNKIEYKNTPLSICFLCPHITNIEYPLSGELCLDLNKPSIRLEVWQHYLALVWKAPGKCCEKKW